MPAIEHGKIEWREQPLVRIEHERIRRVATIKDVAHLRNDRRGSSVGRINMQPKFMLLANLNDRRNGINAGSGSRANCGNYAEWQDAVALVFIDSIGQSFHIHAKLFIR